MIEGLKKVLWYRFWPDYYQSGGILTTPVPRTCRALKEGLEVV